MTIDDPGARRFRFDQPEELPASGKLAEGKSAEAHRQWLANFSHAPLPADPGLTLPPGQPLGEFLTDAPLARAIDRTRDYLLAEQHDDGYWVGELEGDTILESEYILLLTWLKQEHTETARLAANYIVEQQLPGGGWAIYPGGPLEVSASVKAYFALKLTGHSPGTEYMLRAKGAILDAGGAEGVNSFTRFYLALLGVIGYHQCPAIPPELMLVPRWMPFNIYEMSAWSRTILVPLSIMWAHRPVREMPDELTISELFLKSPKDLPVCMPPCKTLDRLHRKRWFNWRRVFTGIDRAIKLIDKLRIRPLRRVAIRKASKWMLERLEDSDGLGAIFPPIIWSVVALRCLGYDEDSPEVSGQLHELEKLCIREGETVRLQPCKSPVWDTAITTIALRDAGVEPDHPAIRKSVKWLLSKEVREKGDWATRNVGHEASGWFFEFENAAYPDIDDTCMVVMALRRCLPSAGTSRLHADFLLGDWSADPADRDASAVLVGRTTGDSASAGFGLSALLVDQLTPQLNAIWRGARWILAMQNRDGGWGAFDRDNDRELFTQVPFADHNAMIDPSSADLTSRMLEMFAELNVSRDFPAIRKALYYVWMNQEDDHSWYGRWGVNYLYGTWQTLVGLRAMGIPADDPRIQQAVAWLKSVQQENGGWGESPESYDDPQLKGQGPVTASQTAWALMGLMATGETDADSVRRGIDYLIDTQNDDGTWDEPWFTGTGFPKVFYLKYHLYRIYFPLMALGRYARHAQADGRAR